MENVTGSAFNDQLIGSTGDNRLDGGGGNDLMRGDAGADVLIGGAGNDTIDYANVVAGAGGVTIVLDAVATTIGIGSHAEGDQISGIENINGTVNDDILTGSALGNRLDGGTGNDQLFGMGGDDTLLVGNGDDIADGGDGNDTVDYSAATTNIAIALSNTAGANATVLGGAAGDQVRNVENIIGTGGNDQLIGNNADNFFRGGAGGDIINGSGGIDTADYATSTAGVSIQLERHGRRACHGVRRTRGGRPDQQCREPHRLDLCRHPDRQSGRQPARWRQRRRPHPRRRRSRYDHRRRRHRHDRLFDLDSRRIADAHRRPDVGDDRFGRRCSRGHGQHHREHHRLELLGHADRQHRRQQAGERRGSRRIGSAAWRRWRGSAHRQRHRHAQLPRRWRRRTDRRYRYLSHAGRHAR